MTMKSKIKKSGHKKVKIRIPLPTQCSKVRESAKIYNRKKSGKIDND